MRLGRVLVLVGVCYAAMCGGVAWADDAALSTKVWGAVGMPVKVAVTVVHEALHLVQQVAGGVMDVTHAALDVLGIPWTPHVTHE